MTLGIDFGFSHVKIVQLEESSNGYTLVNAGIRPVVEDISTFDPEKIGKSHWVAAIQDLTREMKINPRRTKNVISSMAANNVSVRQLSTLEMAHEELLSSLEFEAKKHIPMDGTDPILDFHVIGGDPRELDKIMIILAATSKKLAHYHNEIMKEAGFKTGVFDAEPVSMANAYIGTYGLTANGSDVILNVGNQGTTLVVWGKNQKFFTREIHVGGHHFTEATSRVKGITYEEAEKVKLAEGVNSASTQSTSGGDDSPFTLKMAEKTIYTQLTEEIRKTLRYYLKNNANTFFNKFYICGGSASLPGLAEFMQEQLNVNVEIFDLNKGIEFKVTPENPAQFVVAAGCAIRGFQKKTSSKD